MNRHPLADRAFWLVVSLVASHAALARDDQRGPVVALLPKYTQECGACHVAFPPGMLPADSWHRVLGNLSRHYGTDASLDAATANELATWLSANAGSDKRAREAPPQDRLTRSSWFIRKHDDVPSDAWKLPRVKSAANCAACHTLADQGGFDEHDVRIPR